MTILIGSALTVLGGIFNDADALTVPVGTGPVYIAIDETTNTLYSINQLSNDVTVIDGNTNTVIDTIPVGENPSGAEFVESVNLLYVLNHASSDISVIDPSTNTVIQTIPNISFPFGQEFNPNNDTLYVANVFTNSVTAIDVNTNLVIGTIPVGNSPTSLEVNKNTNLMYVGNLASSDITVIDTTNNTVVDTIFIPGGVGLVGIDETTNTIYVPTFFANQVVLVDGTTNSILDSISVGNSVRRAIFNPNLNEIYANSFDTSTVSIIDSTTNQVKAMVPVDAPFAMNLNRSTNILYVTNQLSNTITVLDITANSPPIANAGINQIVLEDQNVILDGTASFDADGDVLSFNWNQVSGTQVTLSSLSSSSPSFISPQISGSEVLTFQLIVDDGFFQSVPDIVNILVTELTNFDVILSPTTPDTLTGGVTIESINPDIPITLNFINPDNFLTRGELENTVLTTNSQLTDVTVDFEVSSVIPENLPDLPVDDSALFFDINFEGADLSGPDKFPENELPNVKFFIPTNVDAKNRFPDQCPIVPFYLFDEESAQWEQIGMPEEPNTNQIFVSDRINNSVSIIDIGSNQVVETISVGETPRALGFNPDTNLLYVSNFGDRTISVIDIVEKTVIKTIDSPDSPFGMSIDIENNKIYVVNSQGNVLIINGNTNAISETINVPGTQLITIALDLKNQKAFVSDFFSRDLKVIDLNSNLVVDTIGIDDGAARIALDSTRDKAYASTFLTGKVFVIDTKNNTVLKELPVESAPTGVVFNPNNNQVYVTNTISDSVSVIDAITDTVVKNIPVGKGPFRIDIIQDINRIYVSNGDSGTISIIDGNTDVVIDTIEIGGLTDVIVANPKTSNPVRDPGTDVLDLDNSILECSYIANLPHLSKFAVGGIIGTTANFLGGAGGGSVAPTSSLGLLSTNPNFYIPPEIEQIIDNFDPMVPLSPMDPILFEGFDFPLTINYTSYNGYPLVGYENTIETNVVNVGAPITLEFMFFEQTEIQHFSLYSNLYGSKSNPAHSNIQVLYNKDNDLEIYDPLDAINNVNVTKNDLGENKKQIVVELTPVKENSMKDLIIRTWDPKLSSSDMIIRDVFEIVSNIDDNILTTQDKNVVIVEIPSDPIPHWIKNNAGWWAGNQISEDDFLTGIEYLIQGKIIKVDGNTVKKGSATHIPDWIQNNAGWWADSLISDDEFTDAIEWLLAKGVIQL